MPFRSSFLTTSALLSLSLVAAVAVAEAQPAASHAHAAAQTSATLSTQAGGTSQQAAPPPPQHPLTSKQLQKQQKALEKELSPQDRKWLNEDVAYIITPQEREAFLQLKNEEERQNFIEAFWARRNPDPGSAYNKYKEEYYQRIAYANAHFSDGEPGWKTDRGRIYITWGKPDEIDSHPSGGPYVRPFQEGGGTTDTYPFVDWYYNYLPGIGSNIKIEFVDTCMCGNYQETIDPGEKDALLHVPGAGLTTYEEMNGGNKQDRFMNTDGNTLGLGPNPTLPESMDEFTMMEQEAKLFAPPPVKFKKLASIVNHNISYSLLPFQYRTDFVKITDDTVMVPITLQIAYRNMTMKDNSGVDQGKVNIYGRVSTITGRIVDQWDQTADVNIPSELLPQYANKSARYWHAALLKPGRYKVNLVLKDVNGTDKLGTKAYSIVVPQYTSEQLSSSSIILADDIQKVPAKDVGTGQFIIGDTKVRPVMGGVGAPAQFHRDQKLGIWLQVYALKVNKNYKPDATINFKLENLADRKVILNQSEAAATIPDASTEVTVEKELPLELLPPSTYRLTISVTDNTSKQTISPHTDFVVLQ